MNAIFLLIWDVSLSITMTFFHDQFITFQYSLATLQVLRFISELNIYYSIFFDNKLLMSFQIA